MGTLKKAVWYITQELSSWGIYPLISISYCLSLILMAISTLNFWVKYVCLEQVPMILEIILFCRSKLMQVLELGIYHYADELKWVPGNIVGI